MSLSLGDVICTSGKYGIIVDNVQSAWGAKRFKIMFANGSVKYVWDKYMKKVGEASENT